MVYFGYHLVNPHVQTVQNMYGKGGQRVCKAELLPPEVDPYFERKNRLGRCCKKLGGHNFDFRAKSSWEKIFNIYKNFLSGGFCSQVKITAVVFFATPTYFCWQLAFHWHLPTSGRQNTVKTAPQPLIVNSAFFTLYVGIILPIGSIPISLFVFDLEAED